MKAGSIVLFAGIAGCAFVQQISVAEAATFSEKVLSAASRSAATAQCRRPALRRQIADDALSSIGVELAG